MKKLTVSECFASIQGEGKTMGVPSVFIRLAGCNLMCGGAGTEKDGKLHNGATWRCDSIEVWRKGKAYSPEELISHMNKSFAFINLVRKGYHIVFTGGEPMLQALGIIEFMDYLQQNYAAFPYYEFETNGTLNFPHGSHFNGINRQMNVSPKLSNSGENLIKRKLVDSYVDHNNAQFKYVISCQNDVEEALIQISQHSIPLRQVWFMPAASSRKEMRSVDTFVVDQALKAGVRYSHRLHIDIYDQKTGV